MTSFGEKAEDIIKGEIRMISGCKDSQTSADVSNVSMFQLPDPAGRSGGACTSAFLNVLYADKKKPDDTLSFQDVLLKMREILQNDDFEQIPQLSSSRPYDVETKFDITPDNFEGTKRALLIGINYVGTESELSGCQNDVHNIKEYLMDVHGFEEENMVLLLDDGEHKPPTKKKIMNQLKKIVKKSKRGDVIFLHYSGHGGSVRDKNGDEEDGCDEVIFPVDCDKEGFICDDDILKTFVLPMRRGVFATCIMDCCHSGTVLDLPYNFKADGEMKAMEEVSGFNFEAAMALSDAAEQSE